LLDIDYSQQVVTCPEIYSRLLDAVVDSLPNDLLTRLRNLPDSQVRLSCHVAAVLLRHGLTGSETLDVGRVVGLVAKSREADIVRPAVVYLSIVLGRDFEADCLAAFHSATSRFARQQISTLLVRLIVACVNDVDVKVAKLRELRGFLLASHDEGLVEFAFYPTLSALIDEGAGDFATKFVGECGEVDDHDFGGVGRSREFYRSAVAHMERDEMLAFFRKLVSRGTPETDAEWRMCSLVFEVWESEKATLLELFPVKEMVV
jgi:hypothetical protein